jgi:hypothetical protein
MPALNARPKISRLVDQKKTHTRSYRLEGESAGNSDDYFFGCQPTELRWYAESGV